MAPVGLDLALAKESRLHRKTYPTQEEGSVRILRKVA